MDSGEEAAALPWNSDSEEQGFIVAAGGRLFVASGRTALTLHMYNADPENFVQLPGSFDVRRTIGYAMPCPPAIADGRMFVRTPAKGIVCYDLRAPDNQAAIPSKSRFDAQSTGAHRFFRNHLGTQTADASIKLIDLCGRSRNVTPDAFRHAGAEVGIVELTDARGRVVRFRMAVLTR